MKVIFRFYKLNYDRRRLSRIRMLNIGVLIAEKLQWRLKGSLSLSLYQLCSVFVI